MNKKYGALPAVIDTVSIDVKEMMFYQDHLIKLSNNRVWHKNIENRLNIFCQLIKIAIDDFIEVYGYEEYLNSYVYISAKKLYQTKGNSFNRAGWHSDGFMSNDVNYIWSDDGSTVFNTSDFKISQDDSLSLQEFTAQALPENDVTFPENTLLRLDQFNIHRVGDVKNDGLRTFLKVTFSRDKYDLEGNSHNYNINYNWKMKPRKLSRNIPQTEKSN